MVGARHHLSTLWTVAELVCAWHYLSTLETVAELVGARHHLSTLWTIAELVGDTLISIIYLLLRLSRNWLVLLCCI